MDALLSRLSAARKKEAEGPTRVALVELNCVTHFYSKDKLTFGATATRGYVVDYTITELEQKLDPVRIVRIHRSTLLNVIFVNELFLWFGGGMMVRLKDKDGTELIASRDRTRQLNDRLRL